MPLKFKNVIDSSVNTTNWIKGRAQNHRLLKSLCQDYFREHSVLLFNLEVHWLSRVRALTRFFELRKEVKPFLMNVTMTMSKKFSQILASIKDKGLIFVFYYVS